MHEGEKHQQADGAQTRNKQRILQHVINGVDIILVTSAKHLSEPISIERYFADHHEQVRTIALNSKSFNAQNNEAAVDLQMISAIVYESIHLNSHFAIIVDDADQCPVTLLDELIQLALGINTSKNNVNFIFSGGPDLLGIVNQISDIKKLSLVHCSLDRLTEEDIQDFINNKQQSLQDDQKLAFNKHAIKKICSLANGNLQTASALLEWIRLYSQYRNKDKVTVGLINELTNAVPSTSMLSSYPPRDYQFELTQKPGHEDGATESHSSENVEFKKHDESSPHVDNAIKSDEQPSDNKTIYIEVSQSPDSKHSTDTNVFEKVMHSDESFDEQTLEITCPESSQDKTEPDDNNVETDEKEYTDTYHLESLRHLNDPLPNSVDDSALNDHNSATTTVQNIPATEKTASKRHAYIVLLILLASLGVMAWSGGFFNLPAFKSLMPETLIPQTSDNSVSPDTVSHAEQTSQTDIAMTNKKDQNIAQSDGHIVQTLLELANAQIDNKKLTTPADDNAFETFNLILQIEPGNQQALDGLETIKNRYYTWATLDIRDGNTKRAKYFLKRAIKVAPHDREVKQLLADLENPATLVHN